jgi:hypothetical protein
MRYEDTSGSISSSATTQAHDDADTLPNGSNGPATGNVITGAGTTTGKAGADVPGSGHVVEVRGASGSDSAEHGNMHVDGRFGTLAIDDHGNYKYVADGHAPENFRVSTVRNFDAWHEAFDVRPGQPLYLPPGVRVRVW